MGLRQKKRRRPGTLCGFKTHWVMLFVSDRSDLTLHGTITITVLLCPEQLTYLQTTARALATSRGVILRNLVLRFGIAASRGQKSQSSRTSYQTAGQGLLRYNLKIETEAWARIQMIARGLGVSACVVVDRLLRMDADPSLVPGGDPTAGGKALLPRRNIRVILGVCWEIEMTENSMSRRLRFGQYFRDREFARKSAAVRANQKAWCRGSIQRAKKEPGV